MSLSLANHHASLPVAYRLYLPQDWAKIANAGARRVFPRRSDSRPSRRSRLSSCAGRARPACRAASVLMDAGYGNNTRAACGYHGAGIALRGRHSAEHHGVAVRARRRCRPNVVGPRATTEAIAATRKHQPISVKELALGLPKRAWQTITWREGTAAAVLALCSRARSASRIDYQLLRRSRPEEWLLIEWPEGEERADQILALDPARRHPFRRWSTSPSCAGASSATIRSSSRRSGSDISKGADGAASITTPRCASRLTDSWSPSGRRFPPQDLVPPRCSKNLPFPTVTDPEAPPLRPERHVPNSIATMRRRLIARSRQEPCRDARAAMLQSQDRRGAKFMTQ